MIAPRTKDTEKSPDFEQLKQPYQDEGDFTAGMKRDDDSNLESDDSNSENSDVKFTLSNLEQTEEKCDEPAHNSSAHDSDEPAKKKIRNQSVSDSNDSDSESSFQFLEEQALKNTKLILNSLKEFQKKSRGFRQKKRKQARSSHVLQNKIGKIQSENNDLKQKIVELQADLLKEQKKNTAHINTLKQKIIDLETEKNEDRFKNYCADCGALINTVMFCTKHRFNITSKHFEYILFIEYSF